MKIHNWLKGKLTEDNFLLVNLQPFLSSRLDNHGKYPAAGGALALTTHL